MESPTIESLIAPGESIEFENGVWSLYHYNERLCKVSTLPELHAHLVQRNSNAILTLHRLASIVRKHDAYVRFNGKEFEFREHEDGEVIAKSENMEDLFENDTNHYLSVAQVIDELSLIHTLGYSGAVPPDDKFIIEFDKETLRNILINKAKGEAR